MKKIININLSGRVIPIEDSAYEKLQQYVESLRSYFANEESRDEIINDIESRIAELLHDKIRKGAPCVTDADIEEVAQSMGRPSDFEAEAAADSEKPGNTARQERESGRREETRRQKRLYRDMGDKFLGGVCSGIAAYLNIDPTIVRILFAIITFGGFGLGFLLYIILWIILPAADLENGYSGKRLYRNPDDRVIGGVCSGLAAYFGRSVKAIRLIFAAPLLFSIFLAIVRGITWHYDLDVALNIGFGSLTGTFFLAYVILWMVLPEANTTYEKMEMRGEQVNVNTISQNVKDGVDNLKDRMKSWGQEVKETAENLGSRAREFSKRGKAFSSEVGGAVRSGGSGLGHAIGVIFKAFFLFIAGSIAFGLFVALIALLLGGVAWWPINNFLWTSKWQQLYAYGTLIFFIFVPLIAFIIWVIRRLVRARSRNNYLGWTFGFLWTLGWVSVVLLTASVTKDIQEYASTPPAVVDLTTKSKRVIITVSEPALEYSGRFSWLNDGGEGWDLSDDTMRLSNVRFVFNKSLDSNYHIITRKYSYGRTTAEARARASAIQYPVVARDSLVDLASGYAIDRSSKFRMQHVEIEIQVPVGRKIRFDESVNDKLTSVSFRVKKNRYRHGKVRVDIDTEDYDRLRSDEDYTMGDDGILRDEKGRPAYDYSYDDDGADSSMLDKVNQYGVLVDKPAARPDGSLMNSNPSGLTLINNWIY